MILWIWMQMISAQVPVQSPEPWVEIYPVQTSFKPDESKIEGGYYTLFLSTQFHLPEEKTDVQSAVTVFNAAGVESQSDIQISYDPGYEKIRIHKIGVFRNGVFMDAAPQAIVSEHHLESQADIRIYDGRKWMTIHLPDVRIHDIIYIHYSRVGFNPVFGDYFGSTLSLWSQDTMDHMVYSVIHQKNSPLSSKVFNSKIEPQVQTIGANIKLTWDDHSLPPIQSEIYPDWYDPYPRLMLSSTSSWDEVRSWAQKVFKMPRENSFEMLSWATRIKEKYPDERDRITEIIQFVQNEIRYLGLEMNINSHMPADPALVFKRKHGDCKDKSLLLCTLLDAVGVKAYPVLVNTTYTHSLPEKLPSVFAFNHCVVEVVSANDHFFIDPTYQMQEGRIPEMVFPDYRWGLSLRSSGGKLDSLPSPSISEIFLSEEYIVDEIPGKGHLTVTTQLTGQAADAKRAELRYSSEASLLESYIDFYEQVHDEVAADAPLKITDDSVRNSIVLRESYTIGRLWVKRDSTTTSKPYILFLRGALITEHLPQIYSESYSGPMSIQSPLRLRHSIHVLLPRTWSISMEDTHYTMPGLDFTSSYAMPGSQEIDISYILDINKPYIPESEIEAYKKFRSQVETELSIELTDYSDATTGASLLLPISISIITILGFIFILRRLYRWDPEAKKAGYAYDQIGGLLIFPLIGLCITPIWTLITFFSAGFFSADSWSGYFILGYPKGTYLIILVLAELIYNIALIGYSILLIILFFKRRTSTPRLMVVFYLVVAFFTYADYVAVQWILDSYSVLTKEAEIQPGDLIRPLIGVILWAPYFYYSERATGTFSVRLAVDETEEKELADETEEDELLSSTPSE